LLYICENFISALSQTLEQYNAEARKCRDLFSKKMVDYGTAWRILRLSSLADQLFIKARRIRTLEEGIEARVADPVFLEYVGIVNYALMALIQLEWGASEKAQDFDLIQERYDHYLEEARNLMLAKNHDYGEAWRLMSRTSLTDLILMKILRVKQILQHEGQTLVSEGLDANFLDMINYALFALIKMEEEKQNMPVT
jgi:hypothetical protein